MPDSLACPICTMTDILESPDMHECATCGHEWPKAAVPDDDDVARVVKDANGNILSDGDSITLIKDLKLKGTSTTLKAGTKVKGIRLVDGDHEIDCKAAGVGIMLKARFVKKA